MTPSDRSDSPEPSEFGAGVVVCLVKFSEHLANEWARRVAVWIWWRGLEDGKRIQQQEEARRYPRGGAARRLQDVALGEIMDSREPLDHLIKMWASAAGDHFLDLNRDQAPAPLRELADLVLDMRNLFGGRTFGADDWERVWDLWKAATLAVDRQLGIEPDWGQW